MTYASMMWSFFQALRTPNMSKGHLKVPRSLRCSSFVMLIPGKLLSSRACVRFSLTSKFKQLSLFCVL